MALWLIRAGKYGEHEQRFFADSACYLTWEGTEDRSLHQAKDYASPTPGTRTAQTTATTRSSTSRLTSTACYGGPRWAPSVVVTRRRD